MRDVPDGGNLKSWFAKKREKQKQKESDRRQKEKQTKKETERHTETETQRKGVGWTPTHKHLCVHLCGVPEVFVHVKKCQRA